MHIISWLSRKEIVFGLREQDKIPVFSALAFVSACAKFYKTYMHDSLYSILHILIQLIQIIYSILCLVIYFCAQAACKVLFSYTFPTQKKIKFYII